MFSFSGLGSKWTWNELQFLQENVHGKEDHGQGPTNSPTPSVVVFMILRKCTNSGPFQRVPAVGQVNCSFCTTYSDSSLDTFWLTRPLPQTYRLCPPFHRNQSSRLRRLVVLRCFPGLKYGVNDEIARSAVFHSHHSSTIPLCIACIATFFSMTFKNCIPVAPELTRIHFKFLLPITIPEDFAEMQHCGMQRIRRGTRRWPGKREVLPG